MNPAVNRPPLTLLLCLPLLAQAPAAALQDEDTSPQEELRRRNRARLQAPQVLLNSDGTVVLPGEIPEKATPEARSTWRLLLESMRSSAPVQSFHLQFALRQKNHEKSQVNDLNLKFSYLAPSFVRSKLESGRTLLRGPSGDYLIDGEEVIKLTRREGAEDKKQLDQMAAIASNFVSLAQPLSLRLVDLQLLSSPPRELHPRQHTDASKLTWLAVTSPDFYAYADDPGPSSEIPLYRAQLGIDNETKAVRMAVIERLRNGQVVPASATFIKLDRHEERSKLLVPHEIFVHSLDPDAVPLRFRNKPDSRLALDRKRGSLRARLGPDDFLPPVQ